MEREKSRMIPKLTEVFGKSEPDLVPATEASSIDEDGTGGMGGTTGAEDGDTEECASMAEGNGYGGVTGRALDAISNVDSDLIGDTEKARVLVLALVDQMGLSLLDQNKIERLLGGVRQ